MSATVLYVRNVLCKRYYITMVFVLLFLPSMAHAQMSASILEIPQAYKSLTPDELNQTVLKQFTPVTLPLKLQSKASYWIKLTLSKEDISPKAGNLLIVYSELGRDNISYSSDYPANAYDPHLFHVSKAATQTYLFTLTNMVNTLYFDAALLNESEYYRNKLITQSLYGMAYGVMLGAVIYYLAFFLFNREKSYLYYALTQLSMLTILAMLTIKSSGENDALIFGIVFTFFITFSTLFSYYFLGLKRLHPFYRYTLFASAIILVIEMFTDIFSKLHIPTAQLMLLFPLYAYLIYRNSGAKYIIFYILGWGILIGSLLFVEIQILFLNPPLIQADALMHISMPLESLIFAFALSYKMRMEALEQQQQEQMLIHYEKRASIGDMIDAIAHQWRQPLTRIAYSVMTISGALKNGHLTPALWEKKQQELDEQLRYMSQSIDDFRAFYTPNKQKTHFNVNHTLEKIIQILQPTLTLHHITTTIHEKNRLFILGFESELMQVVINLLNNAIEAFSTDAATQKSITITIDAPNLIVEDNAGGVPTSVKNSLFLQHVSTKAEGSGQGLYIAKLIIEHHFNAVLQHEDIMDGARFIIRFAN